MGKRIKQPPNFPFRLESGNEDEAIARISFLSRRWEGGLSGHPIFLQAYKGGKGNHNTQNLIKVNYQGNLINVN
jgi:hypothetical protein